MPSILSWSNLADTASTITATREAGGLGVRNLLAESVQEVWRIPTTASSTDLDVDLGAASAIGIVALFAPRASYLPPGYTVAVFASNVAIGSSEVLSVSASALNLSAGNGAWWLDRSTAPVTARYWRLRFAPGVGDEYLQFGRLWMGAAFRPTQGAATEGFVRGRQDAGRVERAAITGAASASRGAVLRAPRWVLPLLTDAEADQVEAAAEAAATTRQIVSCARTQRGAKDLVLGRFATLPEPTPVGALRYRAEISILEDV